MRFLLICLLLCGLPLSRSLAQDTTVIAAFGDSLFAGYGVAPQDAFPAQLAAKLKADGYQVRMINDGISGDTTAGGVARLDSVLSQKPSVVVLGLGANDMLRAIDPAQVRSNLDTMLSRLHQAGIKVLVVGQKAPLSFGTKYMQNFDPIFCELAAKYSDSCYPFYFDGVYGNPALMQPDGIHPNAQGVRVVLEKIYPSVTALLKK